MRRSFENWPSFRDTDHQKAHKDWVKRAVDGGMRLMVMLAIESPSLCRTGGGDTTSCDEIASVKRQLTAARDLQIEIDTEFGGPGKGWYRIVDNPADAKKAVADGKLAVVLGVETINPFGVGGVPITRLREYRQQLGVRHIFPIHQGDNVIGGTAYFESRAQRQGNVPGDPFPGVSVEAIIDSIGAALTPPVQSRYVVVTEDCADFAKYKRCNVNGLTPWGRDTILELMRAGILIDTDHMSRKSKSEVFEIAKANNVPLVSGHTGFNSVAKGSPNSGQDHEGQLTDEAYRQILDSGGMVGVILSAGEYDQIHGTPRPLGKQGVPYRCGRSSEAVAQSYLFALDQGDGQGIALASDIHTPSLLLPAPRFGPGKCAGGINGNVSGWAPRLAYPFVALGTGKKFPPMTMLDRIVDYNDDGFATIGQYPDLIADLEAVGISQDDLEPLFHSAEAYIRTWEKAELAAKNMVGRMDIKSLPLNPPGDIVTTLTINVSDPYFARVITGGTVFLGNTPIGQPGVPFSVTIPSTTTPCICYTEPYPHPHKVCEGGDNTPGVANFSVRGVSGFLESELSVEFSPADSSNKCVGTPP